MTDDLHEIKRNLDITPNIQFLFAQLEETRIRLLKLISEIPEEIIDESSDSESIESIATLLDHIAAVEWSWIFEDIDGMTMDEEEWKYAFANRSWSKVKQRTGKSLGFYIDRLQGVRNAVRQRVIKMVDNDRLSVVGQEKEKYTVEWILYHLNHHEAQHHGQISLLNRNFTKNP